jgi:hypothetical protein
MSLLDYARNDHSQNGEDGVIERVFAIIGEGDRRCCEFGAWDGIHLSNTRALIERGWSGALIETDRQRFEALQRLYASRPEIRCINATVGADASLRSLLDDDRLDFLSIDIDGLDYQALRDCGVTARLVCVEVNGGHQPEVPTLVPESIAAGNVGQPLGAFVDLADMLGYRLVGYTGNAFFLHRSVGHEDKIPTLSPADAYDACLRYLDEAGREWLYLVNLGRVAPNYRFRNPRLDGHALGISPLRRLRLICDSSARALAARTILMGGQTVRLARQSAAAISSRR